MSAAGRFVGRTTELSRLRAKLDRVSSPAVGTPGQAVLVRGRRRVGKSRLVEEFVDATGLPSMYFTALGNAPQADRDSFVEAITESSLPGAAVPGDLGIRPTTWDAAFALLRQALPTDTPSIVVMDEIPYLVAEDPAFEGALQKHFDRYLSRLPVLLLLIGSDIHMMEQLNTYGRPFYQRGTEMVVRPLTPRDVANVLDLPAADAFDAHLVTGGLPLMLTEWPRDGGLWDYLTQALNDPTSALLVSGERTLAAEFPTETNARTVLQAISDGERARQKISDATGIGSTNLSRPLDLLMSRGVVASETPLSTKTSKETRYRIDDPYLRFWLRFCRLSIPEIERGRGDLVLARVRRSWTAWRGRAVEPTIREALWRLPEALPEGTQVVGGWWPRANTPEVDLVGADRGPVAKRVTFVGSIKWRENLPFDDHDAADLAAHRAAVPGGRTAPMLAVSRSGSTVVDIPVIGPDQLITAWPK